MLELKQNAHLNHIRDLYVDGQYKTIAMETTVSKYLAEDLYNKFDAYCVNWFGTFKVIVRHDMWLTTVGKYSRSFCAHGDTKIYITYKEK